ncbi:hypothetical protein BS50DRAFT_64423 [Corynespora cassiicola Philippines]|uniref:Uncharacterized protein n=1 Tax=Corynespora cassiicola Philippines TaxID=1448308 RepID=A0A2T2NJR6_CORCC|nr:hypothetical protein BS50DRAFT_64423 [Corynespora cassiicola Philippines]
MGNAQSAGHQNKLSKPKTNSNSPPLPAKGESPASTPSKYADLSASDRYQIREELFSPIDQDSAGSRPSSDGDDGLGELASQLQRRLSTLSRSNSLSCFGSKQSSTTKLANLPGSNVSLVSNSHPVDLETALRILQEVKKNASPEDLAALQQALQPSTSPVPEQVLQQRSSIVNRSSSSLTRRRSIVATPGLATRTSMVEPNRMSRTWNSWKTPQLDPKEEAKWRKESTGKSPLARLAASESADGRESPAPRAQTPGDLDYSHLGSLRLGSLVVTNGAASPAPSTKESHRMSTPDLSQEEDYFTASDGHSSPIMMQHVPKKHHRRSKSSGPPSASAMRNLRVPRDFRAEATSACNSPLKTEHHGRNSYDQTEREELQLQSRKSARMLAQDYMSELPTSPYAQSTFGNEAYDEGIVAVDDSKTFREEAFRILDGAVLCETTQPVLASQRLSCDSSGEKQKKRKLIGRPRPKKADSGYSSGGSLQSKHGSRDGKQEGGMAPRPMIRQVSTPSNKCYRSLLPRDRFRRSQ